jgi:hypothetical protein
MEAAGAGPSNTAAKVKEAAQQLIGAHFVNEESMTWSPSNETHESRTITYDVPLGKTLSPYLSRLCYCYLSSRNLFLNLKADLLNIGEKLVFLLITFQR